MQNRTILTIENDIHLIPVVLSTLRNLADIWKFDKREITQMELATEEAVSNVIEHGYEAGEKAHFNIIFENDALGMTITIKEKGIPFDPSQIHEYTRETLEKDILSKGLGTYLMKQCMDEVSFHNLGQEGFETRLYKHLDNQQIQEQLNERELGIIQQAQEAEALPPGSVHYTVHRMTDSEAIDVSKCAYSAYGYAYYHDDIYYPERVRELNRQEKLISYVAVTGDGEIIAHCALERPHLENTPELGMAFTKPKYRGQGCLNQLNIIILEEARKRKFHGLFVQCVMAHPYSQKAIIKYDFKNCAILLSTLKERTFKGIELKKIQRESFSIMFMYLADLKKYKIYPPLHHLEMIRKIYHHLGIEPEFIETELSPELPRKAALVSTSGDPKTLTANIRVISYGANVVDIVHRNLKGACILKNETIYLYLELTDPYTSVITREFEKLGFFFAGIIPGDQGKDQLILQYLNNYKIDYSLLQVVTDMGREILEYIKTQDPGQYL